MIGIPFRDLDAMSLAAMGDAVAAYNAAHEENGPVLTDVEEDDLARQMGIA